MLILGSIQPLLIVCAMSTPSHHVDAVNYPALEPTVVRTVSDDLELTMTITPVGDQAECADLAYEMDYCNISNNLLVNIVIQNPIPDSTFYRVGSSRKGTPPDTITEVTPLFSADDGVTWNYQPVSGGGGAPADCDANVTHVRFMMSGVLTPGATSDPGV
jgi:hypothetical protein